MAFLCHRLSRAGTQALEGPGGGSAPPRPFNLPLHGIHVICLLLFLVLVSKRRHQVSHCSPQRADSSGTKRRKEQLLGGWVTQNSQLQEIKKKKATTLNKTCQAAGRSCGQRSSQAGGGHLEEQHTPPPAPPVHMRRAPPVHGHTEATRSSHTSSKPRRRAGCRPPHSRLPFLSAPVTE